MKKVLILCLHRPDRSPSQRFRFEQYLGFLESKGYRFEFSYLLNQKDDKLFYRPGNYFSKFRIVLKSILKRWKEIRKAKRYDLAFVQREAFMLGSSFFERKIAGKIPMIFDFDDSIWLQNVSEANKKLAFLKDAGKTSKIIAPSSLVFAGNKYLAGYAAQFNKKVVIVPTTIDTAIYQVDKSDNNKEAICIGWSGSFSTIQHFKYAIPALEKIKEQFGDQVYFKIVGDGNYYCEELKTQGVAWKFETEVKDLAEMDIGIMPLPDDEWTKGKCGLKGLQYMALGIPVLMSPVGVNTEIIRDGVNGYLPATENEWIDDLAKLIRDKELRRRIGNTGRQTVIDKYSVEAWKEKYLEYFNEATVN